MKKIRYIIVIILSILFIIISSTYALESQLENNDITSSKYIVSKENMIISKIMPKTDIEELKKEFNVNSSSIHVYDSTEKKELKKGYVGTGMQIKFDNYDITYEASVIGDLNGDGEISQLEVNKVIKHVIGLENYQLEGISAISADISRDGKIDQKDVSLLIKYIVYGRLDIAEDQQPAAPEIVVLNGREGENDWFTSNVEAQINIASESIVPITKTICQIVKDDEIVKTTTITDSKTITFDGEGIYEIKCYSISAVGIRSEERKMQIKIDKTAPICADLIARHKDAQGELYEFGTTSYGKIYLETSEGEDSVSQIAETTIEVQGTTVFPKGTKTPITIENSGTLQVIVTTKNNAGLISTKNYDIIIDRTIQAPGRIITKLNNELGELYESETWTNQNIYVEVEQGGENVETTYQVEGANTIEETKEPTVLTEEGVSIITVINRDDNENISRENIIVKIDKQAPQEPELQVTGEQIVENSEWYISDVQVKIVGKEKENGAPIKNIEYILKNTITEEETQGTINNGETISFVEEGTFELTACVVDEAGNKSEPVTKPIKLDFKNPIAGVINLYTNNKEGQVYVSDTWTNQNVYVELVDGTDELSGHASTVYEISGPIEKEKLTSSVILTQDGIYTITLTTTDYAGRTSQRSYRVRIDKQAPDAPKFEIIEGTKKNPRGEWYNTDVKLEILQGDNDPGDSKISHTTYEVSGSIQITEKDINDHDVITIDKDGIYVITIYNYDIAGNKSEGTTQTIKLDKTEPQNINIETLKVTGTEIDIQVSVEETTSGVVLYQIYVDGGLYQEIETDSNKVKCEIKNQASEMHEIRVEVKDAADNTNSQTKQIDMGRLTASDIDYVEFVIKNFSQTKDSEQVSTGANFIVSDTSVSNDTKYIQVDSSKVETTGEVAGTIRIVRKDGNIVEKFEYYPEDLLIEIAHYADGSGTTVKHESSVNMLNTVIEGEKEATITNAKIKTQEKQNTDNIFIVSDKKISGSKTYTRLIIKQVTKGGIQIPFKITSTVL